MRAFQLCWLVGISDAGSIKPALCWLYAKTRHSLKAKWHEIFSSMLLTSIIPSAKSHKQKVDPVKAHKQLKELSKIPQQDYFDINFEDEVPSFLKQY